MRLNELNNPKVKLAPRAGHETPEQREARREHAKKAIANNFNKGFIDKAIHDRQMKDQDVADGPSSFHLTRDNIQTILAIRAGRAELLDDVLYDKLFQIFAFETGDMPYGTAKARTGDPYQWIEKRIASMPLLELKQLIRQYSGEAQRSV